MLLFLMYQKIKAKDTNECTVYNAFKSNLYGGVESGCVYVNVCVFLSRTRMPEE